MVMRDGENTAFLEHIQNTEKGDRDEYEKSY